MRRERVTGAEVGEEKETARRGEGVEEAGAKRRGEKDGFARFYHSYETTVSTLSL